MTKKVAILGCGPAGLLAAHAANLTGCHFDVFSKRRPSHLFGSQYLHEAIPGIDGQPQLVKYNLVGSPEEYRSKVYGDSWDGTISAEDLEYTHWAWDIRSAYQRLWELYSDDIHHCEIRNIRQVEQDCRLSGYDVVLSTVPRKVWALPSDVFVSTKVWAIGDAPDIGQRVPFHPAEDNTIICDGTDMVSWYRLSRVFGYTTIEWPGHKRPPVEGIAPVEKPLGHNSEQAADFIHLGRYGKWQKGVLTTDAFNEAMKALAS